MHPARPVVIAILASLAACTVQVPVGIDPIVPRWEPVQTNVTTPDVEPSACEHEGPTIGPDMPEICDRYDNDCDGELNEGDVCLRVEGAEQHSRIDLLLVIDPTDEAEDARYKLFDTLPALLDPLIERNRNVQAAMLSMDRISEEHSGRLIPVDGARYVSVAQDGADKAITFLESTLVQVEPPPGPIAARFVTGRAIEPGGPNHGFLRDEAFLAMVFVTAHDDYEEPTVDELARRLDLRVGEERWNASALIQTGQATCEGELAPERRGTSYGALNTRARHDGILDSICLDTYNDVLHDIAVRAHEASLPYEFPLVDVPELGSVEVEMKPSADESWDWVDVGVYSVNGRAVIFQERPPPGARLRFTYQADPYR